MRLVLSILTVFCLAAPAFAASDKTNPEGTPPVSERISKAEEKASTDAAVDKKPKKGKKGKAAKDGKEAKAAAPARADGLVIEDEKVGTGKEAKLGSKITVHYEGTLKSGKVFDSSYKRKEPITFDLAEGALIKGWTEGIPGMKVGGKRKLSIPSAMAYGSRGTPDGSIPANSDLNFVVELIDVK